MYIILIILGINTSPKNGLLQFQSRNVIDSLFNLVGKIDRFCATLNCLLRDDAFPKDTCANSTRSFGGA